MKNDKSLKGSMLISPGGCMLSVLGSGIGVALSLATLRLPRTDSIQPPGEISIEPFNDLSFFI